AGGGGSGYGGGLRGQAEQGAGAQAERSGEQGAHRCSPPFYGRVHFWLGPVWQVHRWTGVPSFHVPPEASRHLPDCGLTTVPSDRAAHFCAPGPLHVHNWIRVPSARPPPDTSRHLPTARSEPPSPTAQRCAPVPLHVQIWISVPSAVPA